MARYIDAELLESKYREGTDPQDPYSEITYLLPEDVESIPTADIEPAKGWISVTDRLPEDSSDVLVLCREKGLNFRGETSPDYIRVGWYDVPIGEWRLYNIIFGALEVIYWMPLPEPPSGAKMDGDTDA